MKAVSQRGVDVRGEVLEELKGVFLSIEFFATWGVVWWIHYIDSLIWISPETLEHLKVIAVIIAIIGGLANAGYRILRLIREYKKGK